MENEKIKKYELVVIVDANQSSDAKEEIIKDVSEEVTKYGAKVINSDIWLEKQKLSFEIKKCTEGTYYVVNFESDGLTNTKITRALEIKEKVLRFMIAVAEEAKVAKAA